jgi:Reverse transcriptase (RNA-dependent DNA polymerase)
MFDSNQEPKSYHETKQTQDSANWWAAMTTEFQNMEQKKFGKSFLKNQSLQTKKLSERDGFAPKRRVDNSEQDGFSQICRKYIQENNAPVVSDTKLHLLLAIKTACKLSSGQFDIETTFLYGELEEELWMAIPGGYPKYMKEKHNIIVDPKTQCLKLTKAIYGLVQVVRQW